MKITYWYAQCLDDSDAYSVRQKTRRDARAEVAEREGRFGPVVKVTVEYADAFDLLTYALSEGGIGEEASATIAAERAEAERLGTDGLPARRPE